MDSLEMGEATQSTQQYTMGVLAGMRDRMPPGKYMKEEHFAAELISGHLIHPRLSHIPPTELFDQIVNKTEGEADSPLIALAKAEGVIDPKRPVNYNRIRNAVDPLFDARLKEALIQAENPEIRQRAAGPDAQIAQEMDPLGIGAGLVRGIGAAGRGIGRGVSALFRGAPGVPGAPSGDSPMAEFFRRGSQVQQEEAGLVPESTVAQITGRR